MLHRSEDRNTCHHSDTNLCFGCFTPNTGEQVDNAKGQKIGPCKACPNTVANGRNKGKLVENPGNGVLSISKKL